MKRIRRLFSLLPRSREVLSAAVLVTGCVSGARAQAGGTAPAAARGTSSAPAGQPAVVHQAQVEARVLFAPRAVAGSDGQRHLAYEVRITSFQSADDPLKLVRLAVFADDATVPLALVEGAGLYRLLSRSAGENDPADGLPIASGRSEALFLWLPLPPGLRPRSLRHQLTFRTAKGEVQRADDVRTAVTQTAPVAIGAPLRGGRWLAVDGPGNPLSHHWGSSVAIDGKLSIPQRFATDWFGLDEANHSLRSKHDDLASSVDEDWVGYGKDVLAVADGVVVDARDGIAANKLLSPQEGPDDLTARTLYGNFVVLRIAPGVYAHYAHLQAGSLRVRAGEHVRRGTVIARLGQTGSAGAPHLHFHVSDLPTFEQSDGLPFVIDRFTSYGRGKIEDTFDPTKPVALLTSAAGTRRSELPLDGDVVAFP